ncbi:MAG: DUF1566 domain-containing protein [Spirochaetales bacterium]|jgi:hypothetical protein|nr:DUF1566 domain-containing protein [Spirochaetales bacterium]
MKKILCAVLLLATAFGLYGQALYTGNGGRGIRLAVGLPEGKNLADETWLTEFVQGTLIGDFQKYSAMTIIDRQNMDKIIAEQKLSETGFYSEENYAQMGNLTNAQYILAGTILKMTDKQFSVQLAVSDAETGVRKASFTKTCTEDQLKKTVVLKDASYDLLAQMGVSLTEEGKKALYGVQDRAVEAETALARGISAQKSGTIVEALTYYYNAAAFDPSLSEASGRLSVLSTEIRGGNIGQNVRNDIERRKEWLKVLEECAAFFKEHLPYEIGYDPALTEGEVDYQKETAKLSFNAMVYPTNGFDVVNNVLEGLNKTGKKKDWGFEGWPLSGPGKVFELNRDGNMDFTIEAALLNDTGRTIASGRTAYTSGIDFLDRDRSIVYGTGNSKPVLFTAGAQDISDKLTVKITKINGRDAAAAGNSGYIKIASFSPPAEAKEYKIGDTGPAGGIVFYDRGTAGGWRYLEALPRDISTKAKWGPDSRIGTGTWTGSGRINTALIARAYKNAGVTGAAAQLCDDFSLNGYEDWFLPSEDELNLMYENLKKKGLGGFTDSHYWSSSEYDSGVAESQNFRDGRYGSYYTKGHTLSVRAVRAF